MKVIIAGSRGITDEWDVRHALAAAGLSAQDVSEVVSGGARGVDTLGENVARSHGIPVKVFPADWEKHGRSAGYIRNKEMAEYSGFLVAVWDGSSRGTKHMIDIMRGMGKGGHTYLVPPK